jgi:hypothetical protein
MRNDRPIAYLLHSRAINKPGILEAGGEPAAVEALVRQVLSELNPDDHLDVFDNLTPTVLGQVLRNKIPDRRQPLSGGPMMIRINDPERFIRNISPWLKRNNPEVDLSHLNRLSRRELTGVLFGAHAEHPVTIPENLKHFKPFYFPIWMLDHS